MYIVFCSMKNLKVVFFGIMQLQKTQSFSQFPSLQMHMSFFLNVFSIGVRDIRLPVIKSSIVEMGTSKKKLVSLVTRGPKRANRRLFFTTPLYLSVLGMAVWPLWAERPMNEAGFSRSDPTTAGVPQIPLQPSPSAHHLPRLTFSTTTTLLYHLNLSLK